MSSQNSGVTSSRLSTLLDQDHDHRFSTMNFSGKGPLSSDWTDEKHSMYLKSMEASFVDQLYSSMDSNRWHTRMNHQSYMRSSEHAESCTHDQFKIHQNGKWQSIQFGKGEPPPLEAESCRFLQKNSWIKHYRTGTGQGQGIQESTARGRPKVSNNPRMMLACGLTNILKRSLDCQSYQDSSVGEEFSDQNFDEEDNKGETGSQHTLKRTKLVDTTSSNDQEVPFGRSCCSDLSHYSSSEGKDWK